MRWRVLLKWRTWMSAWYMRATSATTDVSTRQALSGVSASLDTCCKRTLSLVRKVKWRPPILFCHKDLADISSDASTQESDSLCHLLFEIWFTVCIPVRKIPFVLICLHIRSVLFSWSLWVPSCLQGLILANNSYFNHTLTSLSWSDSNAQLITSLLLSKSFSDEKESIFTIWKSFFAQTEGLLRCTVQKYFQVMLYIVYQTLINSVFHQHKPVSTGSLCQSSQQITVRDEDH